MAEYVTKEQIIEWFRPYGQTDEPIPFETLVSDLRDMKAADVAPVRHGKWNADETCSFCGEKSTEGLDAEKWNYWFPAFCPHCGAKMDLEG